MALYDANQIYPDVANSFNEGRQLAQRNAMATSEQQRRVTELAAAQQNTDFNQNQVLRNNQRQDQADQGAKIDARHHRAWVLASHLARVANDPAQFNALADQYANDPAVRALGIDRAHITPEAVQNIVRQAGIEDNQAPDQPDYGQPVAGVDASGKPQFQRFTKNSPGGVPVTGFAPPPPTARNGMRIQSDGAGGFNLYEGPDAQGMDLTNPARNALQTGAINAQAGIDRLQGIRQGFDPKWLTYTEQAKQYVNSVRAKARGMPFVSNLTQQEQSDLSSFSRFKSDTMDNLNRYITEITGAAMGVQEAKRIISTMPSLDDDPTSFHTKLDSVEQRLRLVLARSVYTQRNGIKFDAIPIDQMRSIMNKRGDELYQQKLSQLKDPTAAKQATVDGLDAEFFRND